MEILRFEEATTTAPKRKKSSKGYLTAGFVAALFGIGTALASATTEIEINDGGGISLGQGVTLATACDTEIFISPSTEMVVVGDTTPTFFLSSLAITGVDSRVKSKESNGLGCGTMIFDIQIFDGNQDPYTCADLNADPLADPLADPQFDALEMASTDQSPDVDVDADPLHDDAGPRLEMATETDKADPSEVPGIEADVETPEEIVARQEAALAANGSDIIAGAGHPGIAMLNRALVQIQMTSDPAKALMRIADVASKTHINGGAILTLQDGKLKPGILWNMSGGKLASIQDLPAGLDAAAITTALGNDSTMDQWKPLAEVLATSSTTVESSWANASTVPNYAILRKSGPGVVVALARFAGKSDHEGLRQSFADLVRAVSPKMKG
jgi:hypothetical protein